ncbi:MAG: hypothetical protein CL489_02970 [Acidobacteria bacterium]|jgi:hypothetical protein|nr:hypothetical protein [Acidobacteriota bacterium]
MSDQAPPIQAVLVEVMREVSHVAKGSRNEAQGWSFRGVDEVLNAVGPALRNHGVLCVPYLLEAGYASVEAGKNRTQLREATLRVAYRFYGPAGDCLEAVVPAEALDSGDKATAKAMSVALRTCLLQTFALPTDEPDPDQAIYERAAAPPAPSDGTIAKCRHIVAGLDGLRAEAWQGYKDEHPDYAKTETAALAALRHLEGLQSTQLDELLEG